MMQNRVVPITWMATLNQGDDFEGATTGNKTDEGGREMKEDAYQNTKYGKRSTG